MIRSKNTVFYEAEDELVSRVNIKLFRSMGTFDPELGSAFAFVSCHCRNTLITVVNETKKRSVQHCPLDGPALENIPDQPDGSGTEFLEVIRHAVSQIRTTVPDAKEREAMRWMANSLVAADFDLKRHQIGDVAMEFGLSHSRSRELCDETLLAIRRVLYKDLWTDRNRTHIDARSRPLLRFSPFLTSQELVLLICLLRNLGWFALIKSRRPENAWAVERLNSHAKVRENLMLVLYGDENARLLF